MHILYVDDSGTADDPDERYFVLGAVAVFERGLFHQIKAADDCVASFGLGGERQRPRCRLTPIEEAAYIIKTEYRIRTLPALPGI